LLALLGHLRRQNRRVARNRFLIGGWHGSELFAECQTLLLIRGADRTPVDPFRQLRHLMVNQLSDELAMFEKNRDFVRPYFQNGLGAGNFPSIAVSETRVEEPGIVDAELAD